MLSSFFSSENPRASWVPSRGAGSIAFTVFVLLTNARMEIKRVSKLKGLITSTIQTRGPVENRGRLQKYGSAAPPSTVWTLKPTSVRKRLGTNRLKKFNEKDIVFEPFISASKNALPCLPGFQPSYPLLFNYLSP